MLFRSQVWVTVDATKPAVKLEGVELNLTKTPPSLIVRWSASDKNFGPRPVTLLYAENADGPWMPLAANIENTGRHECAIPANMPKKVFLRAEAIDLVGNSGAAQTTQVVRFDFGAPATTVQQQMPPQTTVEQPRPAPKVILTSVQPGQGGKQE